MSDVKTELLPCNQCGNKKRFNAQTQYHWGVRCQECHIGTRLLIKGSAIINYEEENKRLRAYCEKLVQGYPEGMLPKDIEALQKGNTTMATEITSLRWTVKLQKLRIAELVKARRAANKRVKALRHQVRQLQNGDNR